MQIQTDETGGVHVTSDSDLTPRVAIAAIAAMLFGIAWCAGDYIVMLRNKEAFHTVHMAIGAGFFLLGIVSLAPPLAVRIEKLIVIAAPYIPGGRRVTDKAADEAQK
jgi:hypothetical protein